MGFEVLRGVRLLWFLGAREWCEGDGMREKGVGSWSGVVHVRSHDR